MTIEESMILQAMARSVPEVILVSEVGELEYDSLLFDKVQDLVFPLTVYVFDFELNAWFTYKAKNLQDVTRLEITDHLASLDQRISCIPFSKN